MSRNANLFVGLLIGALIGVGIGAATQSDARSPNPTAIDSRLEGEADIDPYVDVSILCDYCGEVVNHLCPASMVTTLTHGCADEIVQKSLAVLKKDVADSHREVAPLIRKEIQKMADEGRLILLDPNDMVPESVSLPPCKHRIVTSCTVMHWGSECEGGCNTCVECGKKF